MNVPNIWRLRKQRYQLVGENCEVCGARIFPPRDVCPVCHSCGNLPVKKSAGRVRVDVSTKELLVKQSA
jgi:uncharacterized OB-fold protein